MMMKTIPVFFVVSEAVSRRAMNQSQKGAKSLTELQKEYSHRLHDVTVFAANTEGFSSTGV